MAEETAANPISAVEPPKVNPLAKAGIAPAIHKPGATTAALKPGLKLPPKPGATVAGLKPGLKLPPKPGATTAALKPGLKLPAKPVIRKPGATVMAKPLPKPVVGGAAAPAPAAAVPEIKDSAVPVDAQGVGKLPTVEAQAISRETVQPVVAENPKPMEALKSVTQKLKGITQQIPQQAILRKTGIIAEEAMSDAQKQASKSKTARISLSEAMGVAPVKNENAPMKTIRIKRPVGIPSAATSPKPEPPKAQPAAPDSPAEQSDATITQRKTLKIARPGGVVRPTGKFGIKRPTSPAAGAAPASAPAGSAGSQENAVSDIPDIPLIPDMPVSAPASQDGPAWLWALSALVQAAACVAIGALAWFLFQNTQTSYF